MKEKYDDISPTMVKTVFRLHHLPDYIQKSLTDRNDVHLGLIGSIPELGDFELGKQLIAKPSSPDPKVWEVKVDLPACVAFEFSWLVADASRKVLYWDPSEDHRVRLSYHDAVIKVSWSRDPTYVSSRTSTLIAQTHYYCEEGQALAISGSDPCLGSWKAENCIMANEFPRGSGNWQALTQIAVNNSYEWKWIVVDATTKKALRWEECPNRSVTTNCERVIITAPWNSPSTIKTHSEKIYQHDVDINKASQFYDTVENGEGLMSRKVQNLTSSWKKRRETGEKPFVVTEVEREAAKEAEQKFIERLRRKRSFLRKVGRAISPWTRFLSDCYHWLE